MLYLYFENNDILFFDKIIKKIENKIYSKTILIVPDQYSFYAEKFIYEKIGYFFSEFLMESIKHFI